MADSKITALASIGTGTDPANDPLVIVDVSDVSPGGMSATGTTKKVTLNNLLACSPTATLASATITGDLTVDTNTLKVDSANNRVGIGTATPLFPLDIISSGATTVAVRSTGAVSLFRGYAITDGTTEYGQFKQSFSTGELQIVSGNSGWGGLLTISTGGSERYRIASDGVATWSNVGGVAGTAMTLNATGLGVGVAPTQKLELRVAPATNGLDGLRVSNGTESIAAYITGATYSNYGVGANTAWLLSGLNNLAIGPYGGTGVVTVVCGGAERLRVDTSGNVGIGVAPAGTGGCLQLKSGITFPATQVASSDANTLDDYEEGTFTATLKGTVSDPTTPVTTTARYTKIGRVVTVTIQFSSVTTTGASGRIQIDGLPFTNNSSLVGTGSVGFNGMATFTGSPFASLSASSSTIAMFASNSAGAYTAVTFNAGTTQDLWTSLTYTV